MTSAFTKTSDYNVTPEVQLVNGRYYNLEHPDPDVFTIETIAHSLSYMCRFSGHVRRFYSVAEHCVRASYIGPDKEALERLMHDAAESMVIDLPSPIKYQPGMETYNRFDKLAEACVAQKFGLTYPWPSSVKIADLRMLATERRDLMPNAASEGAWSVLIGVEPLDEILSDKAKSFTYWENKFISRFKELKRATH